MLLRRTDICTCPQVPVHFSSVQVAQGPFLSRLGRKCLGISSSITGRAAVSAGVRSGSLTLRGFPLCHFVLAKLRMSLHFTSSQSPCAIVPVMSLGWTPSRHPAHAARLPAPAWAPFWFLKCCPSRSSRVKGRSATRKAGLQWAGLRGQGRDRPCRSRGSGLRCRAGRPFTSRPRPTQAARDATCTFLVSGAGTGLAHLSQLLGRGAQLLLLQNHLSIKHTVQGQGPSPRPPGGSSVAFCQNCSSQFVAAVCHAAQTSCFL